MLFYKSLFAPLLALVLCLPTAAPAQDDPVPRSAAVLDMFARLPLTTIDIRDRFELFYGNPRAEGVPQLAETEGDINVDVLFRLGRGLPQEVIHRLHIILEDGPDLVGFSMQDVVESATLSRPPGMLHLYRLDPGATAPIGPAMEALGYTLQPRNDVPVWAKGGDFELDIPARNPGNPFGGDLGRTGRVAIDDDLVAWSTAWGPVEGFATGAMSITSYPGVSQLIATLDAPGLDGADLVSAHLYMGPGVLDGSAGVLLADLVHGPDDIGYLAIIPPLEIRDDALRDRIEANWQSKPLPTTLTTAAGIFDMKTVFALAGPDQALVTITMTTPRAQTEVPGLNRPFHSLLNLTLRGDLAALMAP